MTNPKVDLLHDNGDPTQLVGRGVPGTARLAAVVARASWPVGVG